MTADADTIAAGREALARGSWAEARERFTAALEREESGEAWEGLGWAGYWLHDADLTVRSRERAFQRYRARGDAPAAGRVAAWLAADALEFRGDHAVASGWLERAHRLLDELPRCAEQGWLALIEGSFRLGVTGDLDEAARAARRATRLGRADGVADLEAIGLSLEGLALVGQARVAEGMRRIDEASAIATGEELELPISLSWALCYVVAACEGVGDFPRATQWCEVMNASAERWGARHTRGVCRSSYGAVLACCGDWPAAEAELTGAVDDLESARPGMAGGGLVRLGELRARQGRVDEARDLFERAGTHRLAVLGLGGLALDAGDPAAAADAAERVLRRLPPSACPANAGARAAGPRPRRAGRARGGRGGLRGTRRSGTAIGTPYVVGRARLAEAAWRWPAAPTTRRAGACEDALDRFARRRGAVRRGAGEARAGPRARRARQGAPTAEGHARAARDELAALGAVVRTRSGGRRLAI